MTNCMRLGVSARCFHKQQTVEELAKAVSDRGFDCVQLSLPETITAIDTGLGKLSPGMANYIGETFHKYGVQIANIECYINPVHPYEDERKRQINMFKERIRYARDFGCSIVSTETGSLNANLSFNEKNHGEEVLQTLLRSLNELVEEAEKFGVMVCIEGVTFFVAHSPKRIRRILDEIDSNNLQIVFDPVNLLSVKNYKDQDSIIKESFDLFGDRIAILHIKDFLPGEEYLKLAHEGEGLLNYELLLKLIKAKKPYINIILDHIMLEVKNESISYLRSIYDKA